MCDPNRTADAIMALPEKVPGGGAVRLDEATAFDWDRVVAFPRVTPIEIMQQALGEDYEVRPDAASQLTSDFNLLVFSNDGQVVCEAVVGPGLWLDVSRPFEEHAREDAILTVRPRDGETPGVIRLAS